MTPDPGLLATPEELAARRAKAAADAQASLSPHEALVASHDQVSDDDLATKIAAHPDRDILLSLWRRIEDPFTARAEPAGQGSFGPQDKDAEVAALKARLAELEPEQPTFGA